MRLNKFIALSTGMSRRVADDIIKRQLVTVNGKVAYIGQSVNEHNDLVIASGKVIQLPAHFTTVLFNKPIGYVCSRNPQSHRAQTIYSILPERYKRLKSVGRLDKDSSGLILLTNNGDLAHIMTHPKFLKKKTYIVTLDKPLLIEDQNIIIKTGVPLPDGLSRFDITAINADHTELQVILTEGRNRQIRRTFMALDYTVTKLHRISFGDYELGDLPSGKCKEV